MGKEPGILVNNAEIYPSKKFLKVDETSPSKVIDLNLGSVFLMSYQRIKRRGSRNNHKHVNMGTIEAIIPFATYTIHYCVSKAGVITFTRGLAKEYRREGFRIKVITPDIIVTPGIKEVAKEILQFKIGAIKSSTSYWLRLPMGRDGQPDEVARVTLFPASDLSSYVHGALIAVDRGFLSA